MRRSQGGVLSFIKHHWVAYLVGATVAALLGLGLAFFLGSKWSTPASLRAERIAAERQAEMGSLSFEDINSVE